MDSEHLTRHGWTSLGPLLTRQQCRGLLALWEDERVFRSKVVMARHGFGQGEYRYFADPLPPLIRELRENLYPHLVVKANAWSAPVDMLDQTGVFPPSHAEFREVCRAAGQTKPTPLLLRYGPGDYNCLHQDLYGGIVFPLQVVVLLEDGFDGGEFVLVENRPRMQSRATVVPLSVGEGVVFAVSGRPVQGSRGPYRVTLRHGVSPIRSGYRSTLGIIFHDAA